MTKKQENVVSLQHETELKVHEQKNGEPVNLQARFRALSPEMQELITNFFSCHNLAIWMYRQLDQPAREYADYCINLSMEDKKENKQ